jgi:anti-sigma factor RsiW
MDRQPHRDDWLREALEVCRPGSRDRYDPDLAPLDDELAADPALAAEYERIQRADARLAFAMHDVPLPEGLAERLRERLAAAREKEAAAAAPQPAMVAAPSKRGRFSRRSLWVLGAAASLAGAVAVAVWFGVRQPGKDTPATVAEDATNFFQEETVAEGRRLSEVEPPADYPISDRLVTVHPAHVRWRAIAGLLGGEGLAYDLPAPPGTRATLYVVRRTVAGLPPRPPESPDLTTQGCATAAWQEGELLYVLVVQGGRRDYQQYLHQATGPIT